MTTGRPADRVILTTVSDQRDRVTSGRPADRVTLTTMSDQRDRVTSSQPATDHCESDQCDRVTSGRPADRVNDNDNERRCSGVSTTCLLHQGDRRLDDRLSGLVRLISAFLYRSPVASMFYTALFVLDDRLSRVRLCVADRVCHRQRVGTAAWQVRRRR